MDRLRFDLKTVAAILTFMLTVCGLYVANRIGIERLDERVDHLEKTVERLIEQGNAGRAK